MKTKTLKCKNCKQKHSPFNSLDNWCKEIDCQTKKAMHLLGNKKKSDKKKQRDEDNKKLPGLYPRKYKGFLDKECQKLARMIDNKFGFKCIDCGKDYGKQQDGGHFNSKGKNRSLAWNLHNIHSQKSDCNRNGLGGGRERQYYDGLISRYGLKYAEFVDVGLQKEFEYIGLNNDEIGVKLALVRKLIRDFDTFVLTNSISARCMFNNIIGIYKTEIGEIDLIENEKDKEENKIF
jgi:hypothetical protein